MSTPHEADHDNPYSADELDAMTWEFAIGEDDLVVDGVVYDGARWETDGEGGVQRRPREPQNEAAEQRRAVLKTDPEFVADLRRWEALEAAQSRPVQAAPGVSREVDAGEMTIRIDDPDDPMCPPAYEGHLSAVHTQVEPGIYPAASYGDGVTAFDAAGWMHIEVTPTGSHIQEPKASMAGRTVLAEVDGSTLYNTAYLDGAAAAFAELAANQHPEVVAGFDSAPPRPVAPGAAAADMEAAEAAIGLLREDRDRRGYTDEDAATARALRGVLDAAEAWNTVAAAEPAPLEDELRPDRVRSRDWDGDVVVDAGFAGITITVHRTAGTGGAVSYDFLASGPGGRGPLRDVDTTGMGMIAAGDRSPNPARAVVYEEVGAQVRHHLSGLADAVAQRHTFLHQQETRRAAAAQPTVSVATRTTRERSL